MPIFDPFYSILCKSDPELIKDGVVKVDVSSIGTKFENFVQAGCRDLGSHRSRNVYCRKPIILPNLVLFFGAFLELPVLPSITCGIGVQSTLFSRGLLGHLSGLLL